jgi:hypothetical protein
MRGLIGAVRRCHSRLTKHARAIIDPASEARYRRLRASVHNPDYHVNVLPERRTIYIEVSKAACTSLKLLLSEALHGPFPTEPMEVHERRKSGIPAIADIGVSRFFRLVDDPRTLTFTFVRNPYARLVSAYRDKVEPVPLGAGGGFREIGAFFGRRLAALDPDRPLPFAWFVTMACETAESGRNGHWLAMDRLVPRADVVCRHVGRVEHFDSDILPVCDHLGIAPPRRRANATTPVRLADWITPSLGEAIRRAYRADFERFEYSTAVSA